MNKITIIGAGNMGGSLAKGLISAEPDADITITARHTDTLKRFADSCPGIKTCPDNAKAVQSADIVILAVKPWQAAEVINEIKPALSPGTALVSVVAGIHIAQIKDMLAGSKDIHVFYAIPNIASEFGAGMTFIAPDNDIPESITGNVKSLFEKTGRALVCKEELVDAGMLLASCGLAYVMRILRAQTEAGVEMGFKADASLDIAMQTMFGAVTLLRATGEHPSQAIDRVATPGGYTIKGLNEIDHTGLPSAIIRIFKTGFQK